MKEWHAVILAIISKKSYDRTNPVPSLTIIVEVARMLCCQKVLYKSFASEFTQANFFLDLDTIPYFCGSFQRPRNSDKKHNQFDWYIALNKLMFIPILV